MFPCLAIITDLEDLELEHQAAYEDGTKLQQILKDGLPSKYVAHLYNLLCRLGPSLRILPEHHIWHMRERLLKPNKQDCTELKNMRLLLVALYAMGCYLWLQTDLSIGAKIFVENQLQELQELTELSKTLKNCLPIQPQHKKFLDDIINHERYHGLLDYLLMAADAARSFV